MPRGQARCIQAISDAPSAYPESYDYEPETATLRVGDGAFQPVTAAVWDFGVSGLRVVNSWLGYRMARRSGRRSSPLDDMHPERWTSEFTSELLRLLWILEATIALYPMQERLLDAVVRGPVLTEDELPSVPPAFRRAPSPSSAATLWG